MSEVFIIWSLFIGLAMFLIGFFLRSCFANGIGCFGLRVLIARISATDALFILSCGITTNLYDGSDHQFSP